MKPSVFTFPNMETLYEMFPSARPKLANVETQVWPFARDTKPAAITASKVANADLETFPNEVKICYARSNTNKGGVSIAYQKSSNFANTRMVEVAVAYCSPADTFCKKTGREQVMQYWENGQRILVPARIGKNDFSIPHTLRLMFGKPVGYY